MPFDVPASCSAIAQGVGRYCSQSVLGLVHDTVLVHPGAAKGNTTKPDWAHVYLTVIAPVNVPSSEQEAETAAALRAACADLMTKHSSQLRKAAVAQWEIRVRTTGNAPAWRVVVSSPTGQMEAKHWC